MINTIYSIQTYQECRVIMNLIDKKGYYACYTGIDIKFVEIDHLNQQATFSDKANYANKIVCGNLTAFVKRL